MKKKILILSSVIVAASPAAFAISCGSSKSKSETVFKKGRNGSSIGGGHTGSLNAHHFNLESSVKAMFPSISSTKTAAELETLSKTKRLDLTAADLGFTEPKLPSGLVASYSLEHEYTPPNNAPAPALNVHVTIIKAGFTPNSTITFSLAPIIPLKKAIEIVEAIDYTSSKHPYEIAAITSNKQNGLTLTDLGLTINEHLPTGFNVTFSIPTAYTGVEDIPAITAHITNGSKSDDSVVRPLKLKALDATPIIQAFAAATFTSTRNWTETQQWISGVSPISGKYIVLRPALNLDSASKTAWENALLAASHAGVTLDNITIMGSFEPTTTPKTFIDIEADLNANGKFKFKTTDSNGKVHIAFKVKLS